MKKSNRKKKKRFKKKSPSNLQLRLEGSLNRAKTMSFDEKMLLL